MDGDDAFTRAMQIADYVSRWIVQMMGADDERVVKWDEIVAAFRPTD